MNTVMQRVVDESLQKMSGVVDEQLVRPIRNLRAKL
jgi:hypothetical protein